MKQLKKHWPGHNRSICISLVRHWAITWMTVVSLFWMSDHRISYHYLTVCSLVGCSRYNVEFNHDLGVIVSQVVICYTSDFMGKMSVDGKVFTYSRWFFITGSLKQWSTVIRIQYSSSWCINYAILVSQLYA